MQYYKKRKLILYFIEGTAQPSQKVPENAGQNPLPIYERNYEHCPDRKECLLSDIRYQKNITALPTTKDSSNVSFFRDKRILAIFLYLELYLSSKCPR